MHKISLKCMFRRDNVLYRKRGAPADRVIVMAFVRLEPATVGFARQVATTTPQPPALIIDSSLEWSAHSSRVPTYTADCAAI